MGRSARVAVVGAGLAGLTCAWNLHRGRANVTLYEASARLGGRVLTARNEPAAGMVLELGGSFINSDHHAIRALCKAVGLPLVDLYGLGKNLDDIGWISGELRDPDDFDRQVAPLAARIERDAEHMDEAGGLRGPVAASLDRLSMAAYLDRIGASGWLRRWLEMTYISEFGLDPGDQSALNLVTMVSGDGEELDLLGGSDERYRIAGGMGALIDRLAKPLGDRVVTGSELLAIRPAGRAMALSFAGKGGQPATEVIADFVVLTLPFSVLRGVRIDVPLPAPKRRAIAQLGYGNNAKLILGFHKPIWRQSGRSGEAVTDTALQMTWDACPWHQGPGAALTLYLGGAVGKALGEDGPDAAAARVAAALEKVFPGAGAARSAFHVHAPWPRYRWSKGSYSCYRPGQWSSIRGHEGGHVGNLWFAGEHCDPAHQGYMNGAVLTGGRAANAILKRLGLTRPLVPLPLKVG